MSEEPALPPLPDLPASVLPCNPRKRALQSERLPSSCFTSSDPAVFSSDDDPSLESYQPSSERRKRRLIGSWYEHNMPAVSADAHPCETARGGLQRDFDSAVFLASDGLAPAEELAIAFPLSSSVPRTRRLTLGLGRKMSAQEQEARKLIGACVEDGMESIDLSGLALESLSNESIAPITTFTCIPTVVDGAPFEPKDPEIKIFLSNNSLRQLPGAILDIENLTCLSLRGNKLTELPSCIGQLKNLETLNIAQNKLRYLPKSLLDLLGGTGKLHNLLIHPNPFLQPDAPLALMISGSGDFLRTTKTAVYLARSPTQYLSTPGYTYSRTVLPLHSGPLVIPANGAEIDARHPFRCETATNIPSMMELVLRQCYASSHLRGMPSYVDCEKYTGIHRLLQKTQEIHDQRGRKCARCQQRFVMPAVQWVEWWSIVDVLVASSDSQGQVKRALAQSNEEGSIAVPFLAEGCTWSCRPQTIDAGTLLEELHR
ncbi:hypothetical protein TD95_002070 [Thielaviopsis punctulata]|uniref:Uncharacterized protein n=1 Tax=Thielaviopsis punctulata TaxID=72032 RepID=A0A0F4ZJW9_9PEZI|nr:hypothetical protein TD95_002070 [Thielaviopsis punctulata]